MNKSSWFKHITTSGLEKVNKYKWALDYGFKGNENRGRGSRADLGGNGNQL